MTRREMYFKTVKRQMEGYIPFMFDFCPSLLEKFKYKTGMADYEEYYKMPLKLVHAPYIKKKKDFTKYFENIEGKVEFDEWGEGHVETDSYHFHKLIFSMGRFTSVEEFMEYPYPDPINDYDWDKIKLITEDFKKRDRVVMAGMAMTIFEKAWRLRGMEDFMVDMVENPDIANYHLDRITDIRSIMAKKYAEAGVDVLHIGDDVSTQLDMMMSPSTWTEYLKPRLKKVIDSAREVNPEIIIDYHGDGNLQKIIPELIEIGVEVLNPVQPECIDPVKMKELYGDKLAFRGTIGTQTVMPFGTPSDVDAVCKEMIEKVGKGGGLILAPTHTLEPEVPWENIEAFINAIKKYSKYT